MPYDSLYGKVALITGAAAGIGFQIARQFAEQGAKLVLNDLDEKALIFASDKLGLKKSNYRLSVGDASQLSCINHMLSEAKNELGGVDIAIANAGITTFGRFLDYEESSFDKLVQVNLKGSFFLAQKCAELMISQGRGGRIILMSSVTGHTYHPGLTAYGMSKAGLIYLAKTLGVELAEHMITVNAISPGATLTERTLKLDQGQYQRIWESITPDKSCATPQEIARIALFLASADARHITGQTIVVDGGWTSMSPSPYENEIN